MPHDTSCLELAPLCTVTQLDTNYFPLKCQFMYPPWSATHLLGDASEQVAAAKCSLCSRPMSKHRSWCENYKPKENSHKPLKRPKKKAVEAKKDKDAHVDAKVCAFERPWIDRLYKSIRQTFCGYWFQINHRPLLSVSAKHVDARLRMLSMYNDQVCNMRHGEYCVGASVTHKQV